MSIRKIESSNPNLAIAEYIWIDSVGGLRSKSRVIEVWENEESGGIPIPNLPEWSFDGSSTEQATGSDSDCLLKPVHYVLDPLQKTSLGYLVLCEVYQGNGVAHATNTRSKLMNIFNSGAAKAEGWFGFEQEYFLYHPDITNRGAENGSIMGWPNPLINDVDEPAAQGPYYCGVGSENVIGREIANKHLQACMEAGILICGLNAEVALGQWEFQVGYRGLSSDGDEANAVIVSDHLWLARFILNRIAEEYKVAVSYAPKPLKGDWNGSGMHTNFSTWATRDPNQQRTDSGLPVNIAALIDSLADTHMEHMALYGDGNQDRMTGLHETCKYDEFKFGDAHRGCSIRVPRQVMLKGYGYIEDRRPAANADPYVVSAKLLATSCGLWIGSTTENELLN